MQVDQADEVNEQRLRCSLTKHMLGAPPMTVCPLQDTFANCLRVLRRARLKGGLAASAFLDLPGSDETCPGEGGRGRSPISVMLSLLFHFGHPGISLRPYNVTAWPATAVHLTAGAAKDCGEDENDGAFERAGI
jgi:hypothetical protein